MRILQLHSNFIEYEPIEKEIASAEEIEKKKVRLEDIVVAFIAVEKDDDENVAKDAVYEIKKSLSNLKCNKLLLYPYAHLSSDLASPSTAMTVIKSMESLAQNVIEVHRAPFGWTKSFNISVKGHPLAEHSSTLSRESAKERVSAALKAEEKMVSYWYILDLDGRLTPIDKYNFVNKEKLEDLARYETAKKRTVEEQPPHVRLMKKLAIADYEPASDAGNMRFYPKGRLMKSLIEQYVTRKVSEYGGIEVETPIMYDAKHPSMESYFNRFPARQYNISEDNRHLFLRFAACFGQFLMAKDFQISHKNLPLKLYELTRYSFRKEKSGELVGLRRLRAFTMPDCHALCKDNEQAKQEAIKRFKLSIEVIEGLGLTTDDVEMAIRFTEDFYASNKDFVHELVRMLGKPVLVESWKERFFYFTLKWEFNFIDNLGKASALSTDQIDVENGARYNIFFVDEDGSRKNPIILHNSPSGAIERVIYALLERAVKLQRKGKTPTIPTWLAPTQARILPVSHEFLLQCEKILEKLTVEQIRADLDDRDETLAKRIREAETEWIPYIIVIGGKEVKTSRLSVRERSAGSVRELSINELVKVIADESKGKPSMPLNMPKQLSKRPQIMV
ncbi:MAG: threonine--tRNA ligase [Nitrososphaerales archaeon]